MDKKQKEKDHDFLNTVIDVINANEKLAIAVNEAINFIQEKPFSAYDTSGQRIDPVLLQSNIKETEKKATDNLIATFKQLGVNFESKEQLLSVLKNLVITPNK